MLEPASPNTVTSTLISFKRKHSSLPRNFDGGKILFLVALIVLVVGVHMRLFHIFLEAFIVFTYVLLFLIVLLQLCLPPSGTLGSRAGYKCDEEVKSS